ncbi:MAG: ATP-binding cassette domain-containing protein, partial [Spirochaetaceae bacterium]|nr:ATP-binding cassette domain-containing protein [Spirochaetaceae bacterium]
MAFVQFTRVSLAFGDRDILKDAGLYLASGSRAALAGVNGSGKSTLMKIIAGNLKADSGERAIQKGCRVSYLPQSGIVHAGKTLKEEAETAYNSVVLLLDEMEAIGRALEAAKSDDGKTKSLLGEYYRLHEAVENSGYYNRSQTISAVLSGLGFAEADLDRRAEEFSGGWQMRIALAKVLLETPDILLLDEPTNYLDIEARSWLEDWLRSFTGGYLLVSHDRYFLDVTVNEVYELFQGSLKRYTGNYSDYEKTRQADIDSLLKRYAEQQEEIARLESIINRFRYKASKAAFVQERVKKLEKMERIEIPESLKKISINFPPPPHSGRVALTLRGVGKAYGARRILAGLDLDLDSGERLVVVGRNGAGKTTLLRILAGADTGYEGSVRYGAGIAAGYFSQDAAESMTGLAPDGRPQTALEFMEAEAPMALIPKIRDMMGAFLFRGDDIYKGVSVLSGGEKSRLALLKLLLKPMNLLILDEPTNHLDIYSKDIFLETLEKFSGTVIFVSHDRSFMEALSTKTLELRAAGPGSPGTPQGAGRHRLFYGNYTYYLERLQREAAGDAAPKTNTAIVEKNNVIVSAGTGASPAAPPPRAVPAGADSAPVLNVAGQREALKQKQALIRRLERQEEETLAEIDALEAEKAALEAELGKPEIYSSGERARAVKAKL